MLSTWQWHFQHRTARKLRRLYPRLVHSLEYFSDTRNTHYLPKKVIKKEAREARWIVFSNVLDCYNITHVYQKYGILASEIFHRKRERVIASQSCINTRGFLWRSRTGLQSQFVWKSAQLFGINI